MAAELRKLHSIKDCESGLEPDTSSRGMRVGEIWNRCVTRRDRERCRELEENMFRTVKEYIQGAELNGNSQMN